MTSSNSIFLFLLIFSLEINAQEIKKETTLINTQLELIKARQELLTNNLEAIEAKTNVLDNKNQKINKRLKGFDSNKKHKEKDSLQLRKTKHIIQMSPFKLMEGNFEIGFEKRLRKKLVLDLALNLTYVTVNGLGGSYLTKNTLELYDANSSSYINYNGQIMNGGGIIAQAKKYLSPYKSPSQKELHGFYSGFQVMYRKNFIEGTHYIYENNEYVEQIVKQNLDIYSLGVTLGRKWHLWNMLSLDLFAGGIIRLSKYANEKGFTKYKYWNNIDYSGVLPTAGLKIGILQ